MPPTKTHSGNGHQIEAISRTSSVLTPVVKDGVEEIASRLIEIGDLIDDLGPPPDAAHSPSTGELLQEVSELQKEVESVKRAQDAEIKAMTDGVREEMKSQIVQLVGCKIETTITDTIASQVKIEMDEWAGKFKVTKFVGALQSVVDDDDALLRGARIQLENSLARHANSTLDVQIDFNTKLGPIKRRDGDVSEGFPKSLRELFSYDNEQLVWLIKEYELRPLDERHENLNRFLAFIGVNASIPEQFVDVSGDQLPAYASGGTTRTRDEKSQRGARRSSTASQETKKGINSYWGWL